MHHRKCRTQQTIGFALVIPSKLIPTAGRTGGGCCPQYPGTYLRIFLSTSQRVVKMMHRVQGVKTPNHAVSRGSVKLYNENLRSLRVGAGVYPCTSTYPPAPLNATVGKGHRLGCRGEPLFSIKVDGMCNMHLESISFLKYIFSQITPAPLHLPLNFAPSTHVNFTTARGALPWATSIN